MYRPMGGCICLFLPIFLDLFHIFFDFYVGEFYTGKGFKCFRLNIIFLDYAYFS